MAEGRGRGAEDVPVKEVRTVVLLATLVGCATSTEPDTGTALENRVATLIAARLAQDYRAQYDMQAPYFREAVSFDAWKADYGIDESQPARPASKLAGSPLVEVKECGDYRHPAVSSGLFRCLLSVEVTLVGEDGGELIQVLHQVWDHQNGKWYFVLDLHH